MLFLSRGEVARMQKLDVLPAQGDGREMLGLTSRNLPDTTPMHRELVLMDLDFHRACLHIENHMHLARVLRALHLIGSQLDETPVEEGSDCREFLIFERAVGNVDWLNAFLSPSDCWTMLVD